MIKINGVGERLKRWLAAVLAAVVLVLSPGLSGYQALASTFDTPSRPGGEFSNQIRAVPGPDGSETGLAGISLQGDAALVNPISVGTLGLVPSLWQSLDVHGARFADASRLRATAAGTRASGVARQVMGLLQAAGRLPSRAIRRLRSFTGRLGAKTVGDSASAARVESARQFDAQALRSADGDAAADAAPSEDAAAGAFAYADPKDTVIVAIRPSKKEVMEIRALAHEKGFAGVRFVDDPDHAKTYAREAGDWASQYVNPSAAGDDLAERARLVGEALNSDPAVEGRALLVWPSPGHEAEGGAVVERLREDKTRAVFGNSSKVAVFLNDEVARLEVAKPVPGLGRTYRVGFANKKALLRSYSHEVNGVWRLSSRSRPAISAVGRDVAQLREAYDDLVQRGVSPEDMVLQRLWDPDGGDSRVAFHLSVAKSAGGDGAALSVLQARHADLYQTPFETVPSALIAPSQMPSGPFVDMKNVPAGMPRSLALMEQDNHLVEIEKLALLALETFGVEGGDWRVILKATPQGPKLIEFARDIPLGELEFRVLDALPSARREILSFLGLSEGETTEEKAAAPQEIVALRSVRVKEQGMVLTIKDGQETKRPNRPVAAFGVVTTVRESAATLEEALARLGRRLGAISFTLRHENGARRYDGRELVEGSPIESSRENFRRRIADNYNLRRRIYDALEAMEGWRSSGFIIVSAFSGLAMVATGGVTLAIATMAGYGLGCAVGNVIGGIVVSHMPVRRLLPNGTLARGVIYGLMTAAAFSLHSIFWPILVLSFLDGLVTAPPSRISFDAGLWIFGAQQHHLGLKDEEQSIRYVKLRGLQTVLQLFRFVACVPILILALRIPALKSATGPLLMAGIAANFLVSGSMMQRLSASIPPEVDMGNNGLLKRQLSDMIEGARVVLENGILTFRFFSTILAKVISLTVIGTVLPTAALLLTTHWFPGTEMTWFPLVASVMTGIGFLGAMVTSLGMRAVPARQGRRDFTRRIYSVCRWFNRLPSIVKGPEATGWEAPDESMDAQRAWSAYRPFFRLVLASGLVLAAIPLALQAVITGGWLISGAVALTATGFLFNYLNTPTDVGLGSLWQSTMKKYGKDSNGGNAVGAISSIQSVFMVVLVPFSQIMLNIWLYGSPWVGTKQMTRFLSHLNRPGEFAHFMHWTWAIVGGALVFSLFDSLLAPSWMGLKPQASAPGAARTGSRSSSAGEAGPLAEAGPAEQRS